MFNFGSTAPNRGVRRGLEAPGYSRWKPVQNWLKRALLACFSGLSPGWAERF